jgi:PAS domain S-box-containing protein
VRASEQRLQAIIDDAPAVIYLKDTAGHYLMTNRHYERLFHLSRATVRGQTDVDHFPPDVAHRLQANDRAVVETGRAQEGEEAVPQDDGMHCAGR